MKVWTGLPCPSSVAVFIINFLVPSNQVLEFRIHGHLYSKSVNTFATFYICVPHKAVQLALDVFVSAWAQQSPDLFICSSTCHYHRSIICYSYIYKILLLWNEFTFIVGLAESRFKYESTVCSVNTPIPNSIHFQVLVWKNL